MVRKRRGWSGLVAVVNLPVNYTVVAAILLVVAALAAGVYVVFGRPGGNFVLTNLFSAILGLTLGVTWPAVRRAVLRARSPVEVGEYLVFAGERFPFKVIDGPATYQPHELVLQVTGDLVLPDFLRLARSHMTERMQSYRGSRVLFDGQCYVMISPPLVRRNWENIRERPTVVVEFRKTTYFVRVLCRGAMAKELEKHISVGWPEACRASPTCGGDS